MSLDPFADIFARHWPRSLPRLAYRPPALETLNYLHRRVQRATRELDLPALDARQRRVLALRRGPKLRARLIACLEQLPRQPASDLWAGAAAPVLQEILARDGELEQLRREARELALQAEDTLLVLSIEVGVLVERALASAPRPRSGSPLPDGLRRARQLLEAGAEVQPLRPVRVRPQKRRPQGLAWQGPLERCLAIPEALLGLIPQRLRKVRRRLGAPALKDAQRQQLLRRGPHGRESAAVALVEALLATPALATACGVDGAYLQSLLDREGQLRALRRGALHMAELAEGAQLLLGAYGRCLYEMLIELLQGRMQNPQILPSERRRLGAEFAPLLRLARLGDERLPDGGADAELLRYAEAH